jgi:hypothetical protein
MLFIDVKKDIYIDTCCHINERGNQLIGSIIGKAIVADSYKEQRSQLYD